MGDPLRIKLKVLALTSLGLLLSLGVASGARWIQGSEAAATPAAVASPPVTTPDSPSGEPVVTRRAAEPVVPSDIEALAAVSRGLVAMAKEVTPAVVSIDTRGTPERQAVPERLEELFGPFRRDQEPSPFDVPLGRGSGFIVSEDGFILTNNHVVARAERITVELLDGRSLPAELIGRDPTTDVAVLKVDAGDLPTVKLGDSDIAEVGELVMAVGNPGTGFGSALPFTVTTGIISAKGRRLGIIQRAAGMSQYAIEDLIQTDAVINPGNSGGPLVNHQGEVIGINTAIASVTGFYQGYGFAIPIMLARDVMEDLIEYGRVRRAALGVSVADVSRADARLYGLSSPRGVLVQDFTDDSPAQDAGLKREDVIVTIEGRSVDRVGQLQSIVASFEPGERVKVGVVRFGEELEFTVRLKEAPVPSPEVSTVSIEPRRSATLLGVQVQDLTPDAARRIGWPENAPTIEEGVLVTEVARFGPAASSGLPQGWIIQRVNGQRVRNVREFDHALEELEAGSVVSLDAVGPTSEGDLMRRVFNFELPQD